MIETLHTYALSVKATKVSGETPQSPLNHFVTSLICSALAQHIHFVVKGDDAHAILHGCVACLDPLALVKGLTCTANASTAIVGNADLKVFD